MGQQGGNPPLISGGCCCPRFCGKSGPDFHFLNDPKVLITAGERRPEITFYSPQFIIIAEMIGSPPCKFGWIQEICHSCMNYDRTSCTPSGNIMPASPIWSQVGDGICRIDYKSKNSQKDPEDATEECPWYEPLIDFNGECQRFLFYDEPSITMSMGDNWFVSSFKSSMAGKTHLVCVDQGGIFHIGYFDWSFSFSFEYIGKCPYSENPTDYVLTSYEKDWVYSIQRCNSICADPTIDNPDVNPFDCDCSFLSAQEYFDEIGPTIDYYECF